MALPQYNHSQGDSQGYSKIWLQGLRSPKRRSTFNAALFLVHAFVFSCLDYCNSIFAGLLGVRMEKLRRVHRCRATYWRVQYMQDALHWLSFSYRNLVFCVAVLV